jgi:hypothetical protein
MLFETVGQELRGLLGGVEEPLLFRHNKTIEC